MSTVLTERPHPHVALLTLNRPERLNAMSIELCLALKDALDALARDNACWIVVLTGAGRAFSSGLDLKDHGMIPDIDGLTSTELGASWLLPRLVGAAHANDLLYTGRRVDAGEALRMGLVSRVVSDASLLDETLAIAEDMCRFSPYGLQMTKQVIWANLESTSLEAAIELEDRNQLMLGMTDNLPEAIAAFDENRAPVY